ncbi:MAG: MAPEG family protein [Alphaproteobacteria bacterium]|nr:MAPEG family protein [Alphaproteobacteria bacterium]
MAIIIAYPFVVLLIGVGLNLFVFGVSPLALALPSDASVSALVIASVLLAINHTWLMTTTELTRVRYKLHATPEEWAASGTNRQDAQSEGLVELERRHNAHRNTTENVVYFIFLAFIFALVSPTTLAAQVWIIGFAVARLGYTYSYLAGKDGARGLFMSLSLLAMYAMASYLVISLVA